MKQRVDDVTDRHKRKLMADLLYELSVHSSLVAGKNTIN